MRRERLIALVVVLGLVAALAVAIALLDPRAEALPPEADGPHGTVEEARVVRVVDGDTVKIEIDGRRERLRYVGVDAPELVNADAGLPAEHGAIDRGAGVWGSC